MSTAQEDPYLWLEDVESEESLSFARASNEACLKALGNPEKDDKGTGTYKRILAVLESDDRIPHVTQFGVDDENGKEILINFWKDSKNPKGLWRYTDLASFKQQQPVWKTILDVDQLAEKDGISWVYKGSTPLSRSRDPVFSKNRVSRALLSLSRGGSDATHVKEFDMLTQQFVTDDDRPFVLPEAKSRTSYQSRDVLLVGTDMGPGSLTDSGYPRTVREWSRGTDLKDAPIVFEGETTDVSVGCYIVDERTWGGPIYQVQSRALTFYTSKYWVRGPLQSEHLLAANDPARAGVPNPPAYVPVDVQDDADIDFLGKLLLITLRSDWTPVSGGATYQKGSVLYVETENFLKKGSSGCEYQVLFAPTERTAFEYYTATKNYLIVSTMDNVKSKLDFFKISDKTLTKVSGSSEAQIRSVSVRPVDPYTGSDEFWYTTSDYVSPSTLYLADAAKVESPGGNETDAFITEKLKSLPDMYDSKNLVVEQRTATSKDGTAIPYFIIMHKDTKLDGNNPTLLYGYGGFEVSLGPHYAATAGIAWLERGGVYVEANIRGGGEFGPAWHQAGLKANRSKCYEDFIGVAEHLIETNVCRSKTLAVRGGSNGGLLVANMYAMRPDLFGAIHCAVPLM